MGRHPASRQRRRFDDADRKKVLAEFARSGQTQARFARRKGISPTTLQNWLRRSRSRPGGDKPRDLLPVRLRGPVNASPCLSPLHAYEIAMRSGRRLLVQSGFDAKEVRALVGILDEGC